MINNTSKIILFVLTMILINLWPQSSKANKYEYDALNRLTRVVYDSGVQITYNYDKVGNRTQKVSTLMADTSLDGSVDFKDFAIMASRWLEQDCGYSDEWCEKADLNWSTAVNIDDLVVLVDQWLESN